MSLRGNPWSLSSTTLVLRSDRRTAVRPDFAVAILPSLSLSITVPILMVIFNDSWLLNLIY